MEQNQTNSPKRSSSEGEGLPLVGDNCTSCAVCGESRETTGPETGDEMTPPPYHGWRLARVSILVFFLPLVAAMVGAGIAGGSAVWQVIGGLGGGLLGFLVSYLLIRFTGHSTSSAETNETLETSETPSDTNEESNFKKSEENV